MRDLIIAAARQTCASWRQDAEKRRLIVATDEVAAALDFCASEMESELARVSDATRLLTVEQFAREHGHTPSTVRRWCLRGELVAEKSVTGDWEIPRNARRVKQPIAPVQAAG